LSATTEDLKHDNFSTLVVQVPCFALFVQ
jgi:hypothetical protein